MQQGESRSGTIILFFENSSISLYGCFMSIILRKFFIRALDVFMASLWLLSSVNFQIRALDVFMAALFSEMLKLMVILLVGSLKMLVLLLVGSFEDDGWCQVLLLISFDPICSCSWLVFDVKRSNICAMFIFDIKIGLQIS